MWAYVDELELPPLTHCALNMLNVDRAHYKSLRLDYFLINEGLINILSFCQKKPQVSVNVFHDVAY